MTEELDAAIAVRGLSKIYRGKNTAEHKEALKGIDLTIPKGLIYGLLGPNGAGKSTFINILAGLTVKTSGKVFVNGIDQDEDARGTRFQLGVVPQEVVLDPFFSIHEILEYHAGYYGIPKAKRRTQAIIDALHLTDKTAVNSRRLSGGMKRRVLIAKALVHSPPILILDEPTAGVDVELRTQLWEYVRELNAQGTTIVLTTHYLEEAEELCDHITIIDDGQIIADENKKTLMRRLDQKQLTLRFKDAIRSIPEALSAYNPTQIDDHSIQIRYRVCDVSISDVLHHVQECGMEIRDLSTEEPDLEDIFRHLVQGKQAA